MINLVLGIVIFFGVHSISIVAPALRDRWAARGVVRWQLTYSVISLFGLVLMVKGYFDLRLTPSFLYIAPIWLYHVSAILLLPVFVLFFAPYFPGRISRATKHPQLVAVKLWAAAHLLVNDTVADILFFGAFLVWAIADRVSMKTRVKRPVPGAPESNVNDAIIVVLGLCFYAVTVFWLHQKLFDVSPIIW